MPDTMSYHRYLKSTANVVLTGNEFTDDDAKYFGDALSVSE